MPLRVECPHCRSVLAVPSKFLGTTQTCPQCGGMFQAPVEAPFDATAMESGEMRRPGSSFEAASGTSVQISATPTAGGALRSTPSAVRSGSVDPPSSAKSSPPPASAQPSDAWMKNKVARFITEEQAVSKIQPTTDGRLPGLSLEEAASRKREISDRSSSPWLLPALLTLSILASFAMLFIDPTPNADVVQKRANARREIEEKFFQDPQRCRNTACRLLDTRFDPDQGEQGVWTCDACGERWSAAEPGPNPPPLREYQVYLRRAQQAYARGDYSEERRWYHRVLDMLRAEKQSERYELSVTGRLGGDEALERLISEALTQ